MAIKPLGQRKSLNLINSERTTVDHKTGEVIFKEKLNVKTFQHKEQFVQFYIENASFIEEELSPLEKSILFAVVIRMGYNNCVNIGSDVKLNLIAKLKISRASVFRGLKGLVAKQLLYHLNTPKLKAQFGIYDNNTYLINPNIFGKGNLRDIQKVRQIVIKEFDFVALESKSTTERTFFYEGYKELENNPDNFEIENIEQEKSDNSCNTDVTINKKDK